MEKEANITEQWSTQPPFLLRTKQRGKSSACQDKSFTKCILCFVVETRGKTARNYYHPSPLSTNEHWRHSEMYKSLKDDDDELKAQCFDKTKSKGWSGCKSLECIIGNWWFFFTDFRQLHCRTVFSFVKCNPHIKLLHGYGSYLWHIIFYTIIVNDIYIQTEGK